MVKPPSARDEQTTTYASFNVENAPIRPAVLIITNQPPLRVRRQRRLAGTRQAKEHSHVAILTLIGRRVQRQHVVLDWHLVEQDREDSLLHLAGVLRAEDDHLSLGKVDGHGRRRGHALGEAVGRERPSVVDHIVWVEGLELLAGRADQHVAHEQRMVGPGAHHPHADSVPLIPARISINHVDSVSCVEIVDGAFSVDAPDLLMSACEDFIPGVINAKNAGCSMMHL